MNLMIAVLELAAVINVRRADWASTREGDVVIRGAAWLWSSTSVTRIAQAVDHNARHILTGIGVQERSAQAGAIQGVEEASMEVAFVAALLVTHVRPATMDARITQE